MARTGSRWGFTGQASKQLAGEWESFKRQGEEEILIQPCISQWRSHFYNLFTVSLALTNTGSQSALSHFTQDNFLKAAVGKRGNGEGKGRHRHAENGEEFKKTDELRVRQYERKEGEKRKTEAERAKKGDTNRRNHAMAKTDMAQQKAVCGRPGSRKIERLSVLMTASFSLPCVSRGPMNKRICPQGPMRAQKDRVSASSSAQVIKGAVRSGSC